MLRGPETADSGQSVFSFWAEKNQSFGRRSAARFLGKMNSSQIGTARRTAEEKTFFVASKTG
jgi:hypothetical protein